MAWYDELQRRSTFAETAVGLYSARAEVDVTGLAPRVTASALWLTPEATRWCRSKRGDPRLAAPDREAGAGSHRRITSR
jgi:hypothetical protein